MSEGIVLTVHGRGSEDAIARALALARTQGHKDAVVTSCRPVLGQTVSDKHYAAGETAELAWTVGLAVR